MYGRNFADTPKIVGKMWDCVMTTDYIAPGGKLLIQGNYHEVVSSQPGAAGATRSSLLWRYEGL
jgi:hypothetical protein